MDGNAIPDPPKFLHPRRTHPVHGIKLVDGQPTVIFDTVCTKGRTSWLAIDEVHRVLQEVWYESDAWLMGKYVVMPDHIHLFAWYTGSVIKYEAWVKYSKSQFSKRYKRSDCEWQPEQWDTRMRNLRQYEEKWIYTRDNPVRAGLVNNSEDWPYQGEIHRLCWE